MAEINRVAIAQIEKSPKTAWGNIATNIKRADIPNSVIANLRRLVCTSQVRQLSFSDTRAEARETKVPL